MVKSQQRSLWRSRQRAHLHVKSEVVARALCGEVAARALCGEVSAAALSGEVAANALSGEVTRELICM
ncbi:hypothetical protein HOLleu_22209 [Holothuria leucospilota]|uniref:Uncharacterized protein n=1 Tax=Holothuria leucospilota TaxID=206669 RepID=A0A9Q1H4H4_HOLLE|nr:hypothetical protein HOLleu_22209 [Holothuria leucospilota]